MRIPESVRRPGRIVAGFTSATGLLFGATWLLDRALVWQLRREAITMAGGCTTHDEPAPLNAPRCVAMGCPKPPTNKVHGWEVCEDHDPTKADNFPAILVATRRPAS